MSSERAYRDQAIVLRGRIFGEADRIITLLTAEHGKIDAIAKAVRRPRTKLAGLLELASEVTLECHHGRTLDIITDAEIVHAHWQQLLEPDRYGLMTVVLESIDSVTERNDPQPEMYALLQGMLSALARFPDPLSLLARFELRLLDLLGFAPEFQQCVRCGRALFEESSHIVVDEGGAVCVRCAVPNQPDALYSFVDRNMLTALGRAQYDPEPARLRARGRIAAVVHRLFIHQVGRRPRSETAVQALLELGQSLSETPMDGKER